MNCWVLNWNPGLSWEVNWIRSPNLCNIIPVSIHGLIYWPQHEKITFQSHPFSLIYHFHDPSSLWVGVSLVQFSFSVKLMLRRPQETGTFGWRRWRTRTRTRPRTARGLETGSARPGLPVFKLCQGGLSASTARLQSLKVRILKGNFF